MTPVFASIITFLLTTGALGIVESQHNGMYLCSAFGFLLVVMVAGLFASLSTISLLVYWHRGWVCRPPSGAYTAVRRSGSTITITEEMDTTSEA